MYQYLHYIPVWSSNIAEIFNVKKSWILQYMIQNGTHRPGDILGQQTPAGAVESSGNFAE